MLKAAHLLGILHTRTHEEIVVWVCLRALKVRKEQPTCTAHTTHLHGTAATRVAGGVEPIHMPLSRRALKASMHCTHNPPAWNSSDTGGWWRGADTLQRPQLPASTARSSSADVESHAATEMEVQQLLLDKNCCAEGLARRPVLCM